MLASFLKVLRCRYVASKIDVFDYPTVVWQSSSKEPPRISAQTWFCHWLTFLPPIVWVDLHSNYCGGPRKTHLFCNRVRIGRSRSSKFIDFGTNRKRVCDFLLVINSNLCPILPNFRDIAGFLFRTATPLFSTGIWGRSPWTRLPMLWLQGPRRPYTLTVRVINLKLVQPQHYRQTDRRTTTYDSNTALALRASRGNNKWVIRFPYNLNLFWLAV